MKPFIVLSFDFTSEIREFWRQKTHPKNKNYKLHTAYHIEGRFRRVGKHVKFFGLSNIYSKIVYQFLGILDEDWDECL